jgi:hypothetical protein
LTGRALLLTAGLLLLVSACDPPPQRQVVERYPGGQTKVVAIYSDTGSRDAPVRRETYSPDGTLVQREDVAAGSVQTFVDLHPAVYEPQGLRRYLAGEWVPTDTSAGDLRQLTFRPDTLVLDFRAASPLVDERRGLSYRDSLWIRPANFDGDSLRIAIEAYDRMRMEGQQFRRVWPDSVATPAPSE